MILILMVKMVKVMNKVVCDKCKDEFNIKFQTKNKGNLQVTYFECPKCHEEYIVNVTDENLRKDINKAIELRNKMLQDSNNKESSHSCSKIVFSKEFINIFKKYQY